MTTNFGDPIYELFYYRFKDLSNKTWFRAKDSSVEGLGDLLGCSDQDFNEFV